MSSIRWSVSSLVGVSLALTACVRLGFDRQQVTAVDMDGAPLGEQDAMADRGEGPDAMPDQGTTTAGQYESCSTVPCAEGMDCIQTGTGARFCMTRCVDSDTCTAGETCDYMAGSAGSRHCIQACSSDEDCPAELSCVGFGPYPQDHCAPTTPLGVGEICETDLDCMAGTRCVFGYAKPGRCTEVCPTGDTCPSTHLCYDMTWESRRVCLRECAPLDDPVKCATHEVCYPNPEIQKAYCINAVGSTGACNTSGLVCATGRICVAGNCPYVCDGTHPCPTGQTCTTITWGGTNLPWKACK